MLTPHIFLFFIYLFVLFILLVEYEYLKTIKALQKETSEKKIQNYLLVDSARLRRTGSSSPDCLA